MPRIFELVFFLKMLTQAYGEIYSEWKKGRAFCSQGKGWNFVQTGKVREFCQFEKVKPRPL